MKKKSHKFHEFVRLSTATEEIYMGHTRLIRKVFKYECECGETEVFYRLLHDYENMPEKYTTHVQKLPSKSKKSKIAKK